MKPPRKGNNHQAQPSNRVEGLIKQTVHLRQPTYEHRTATEKSRESSYHRCWHFSNEHFPIVLYIERKKKCAQIQKKKKKKKKEKKKNKKKKNKKKKKKNNNIKQSGNCCLYGTPDHGYNHLLDVSDGASSRKHAYIILTPLNPTFI